MLEKIWDEYFSEECAAINTDKERALLRNVIEMQGKANEMLTKEQREAVEKYVEAIYKMQSASLKKVFIKGCKLAASFLVRAVDFGK